MREGFAVSFEVITPESAENGDFADCGFELENVSLRRAVEECGLPLECSSSQVHYGCWYMQIDGSMDYSTGAYTRLSLHPPTNITEASARRLHRLLSPRRFDWQSGRHYPPMDIFGRFKL